jgi:hypothetical protein
MQDVVTVVGYPIGGDTMSVTSGVMSLVTSDFRFSVGRSVDGMRPH